jgi:hypothetical protein
MKIKNIILIILLPLSFLGTIKGQESTVVSGNEASGSEGKISYSVGQVFTSSKTGNNGSVQEGAQQTYTISTGLNDTNLEIVLSAYPNPTTDFLTLNIEDTEDGLNYKLFDIKGKLIESKEINQTETKVNFQKYTPSIYFLKVMDKNKPIKTFKILKN